MSHLLSFASHDRKFLNEIFSLAADLKSKQKNGVPHRYLEGKTLAMIFEKSSTRTRVSFETGIFQLGGQALFLSPGHIQMGRGEPISDTARVLSRYVHIIMIRTFGQDIVEEFSRWSSMPVINGLTDKYHPCQVLADVFTAYEYFGTIEGKKVAWIGDGNNMANSWIEAACKWDFKLKLACPENYEPDPDVLNEAAKAGADIELTRDPLKAAEGAHVINTDVWLSMGMEGQEETRKKIFKNYQVNDDLMKKADSKAIVMHCLPAHRGEEITTDVFEKYSNVIFDQAENRLHVQKAIMVLLMGAIK